MSQVRGGERVFRFFLFWLWIWAPQNTPLPEFLIVNFDIADFGFEHSKHPHPNWNFSIQECIPVGCVPPAHWPHLVVSAGGARGYASLGGCDCPGGPGGPRRNACWGNACPGGCLPGGHACPGAVHVQGVCVACMPPVNRMTDACENITLHQTSLAGGKNAETLLYTGRCLCCLQTDNIVRQIL